MPDPGQMKKRILPAHSEPLADPAGDARSWMVQFFRYGLIGTLSNLLGYLLFLLITYWGIEPKTSMSLLYVTGAAIGFFGNRKWTFSHQGTWLSSGFRYCIAHLFGYSLNYSLLLVFVDLLGYSHALIQAIAIFVVAGFLFVMFKYLVFPEARITTENRQ